METQALASRMRAEVMGATQLSSAQLNVLIPWLAVLKKKEKGDDLQSDLGCLVLKTGQTRQKEPGSLKHQMEEGCPSRNSSSRLHR